MYVLYIYVAAKPMYVLHIHMYNYRLLVFVPDLSITIYCELLSVSTGRQQLDTSYYYFAFVDTIDFALFIHQATEWIL